MNNKTFCPSKNSWMCQEIDCNCKECALAHSDKEQSQNKYWQCRSYEDIINSITFKGLKLYKEFKKEGEIAFYQADYKVLQELRYALNEVREEYLSFWNGKKSTKAIEDIIETINRVIGE